MSDMTFIDRLTRKRNTMLQKRLQVRLQIMGEEYRMTKKDLDKHTQDLSEFLVYIKHTVPGLSGYCQPDTRSMKVKSDEVKLSSLSQKLHSTDKILHHRQSCKNESDTRKNGLNGGKIQTVIGRDCKGKGEEFNYITRDSDSSCTNRFSHRGITINKESPCRVQHKLVNNRSLSANFDNKELRKIINDSSSIKESIAQFEGQRASTSMSTSHRTQPPKYGRHAYTQQDEMVRKIVFSRFETIFDLHEHKQPEKTFGKNQISTNSYNKDTMKATTPSRPLHGCRHRRPTSCTNATSSSSQIMKNRLTWSAPLGHRIQNNQPKTCTNILNHRVQSIQPESRTSVSNHQLQSRHLQPEYMTSSAAPKETTIFQAKHMPVMSLTSLDDINDEFKLRVGQQPQKNLKRPKTAPPNYELKQKSVPAPRQQVAGFQAEIQTRGVATRVILKKSRQLQDMVKMLAPSEQSDDSLSE